MAGKSDGENVMLSDFTKNDGGEVHLPPVIIESKSMSGGYEGSELFDDGGYGSLSKEEKNEIVQKETPTKNVQSVPNGFKKLDTLLFDEGTPLRPPNKHATAFLVLTEMLLYLSFLALVTFLAFSLHTQTHANIKMSEAMSHYFVTDVYANPSKNGKSPFENMQKLNDIWDYIEKQLLVGIYRNEFVTNGNVSINENQYLGNLRLRMLKVKNGSCTVSNCLNNVTRNCALSYNKTNEDKGPFGSANQSAFVYTEASDLNSPDFTTSDHKTYGGGGFVQDLPMDDRKTAYKIIRQLKKYKWLDYKSRVVFMDFAVYNQQLNIFTTVKIYVEIEPSLKVFSHYSIKSVVLDPYVTFNDDVVLVGEGIFCSFVLIYMIVNWVKLVKWRLAYFYSIWNLVDLVIVSLSIIYIIVSIIFVTLIYNNFDNLLSNTEKYIDLTEFIEAFELRCNIMAPLVFACWIKVFKYFGFTTNRIAKVVDTFYCAASELITMAIVLFLAVFSFSQFAYMIYGSFCPEFSRIDKSFFAMIRMLLGDFDYYGMSDVFPYVTPLFVGGYVLAVFIILMNANLVIVHTCVGTYVDKSFNKRFTFAGYLSDCFNGISRKLGCLKKPQKVEPTEEFEWEEILTKHGYTKAEIADIERKYNTEKLEDSDREGKLIANNIDKNKPSLFENTMKNARMSDYIIRNTLNNFDIYLKNMLHKLDEIEKDYPFYDMDQDFIRKGYN